MLNQEYWESCAILINKSPQGRQGESQELSSLGKENFQKGITFMMVEEEFKAKHFLEQARHHISIKMENNKEYTDNIYLYFINWAISGATTMNSILLDKCITDLEREIIKEIVKGEISEIFEITQDYISKFPAFNPCNSIYFTHRTCDNKYPYESLADLLIHFARLLFLNSFYMRVEDTVFYAQKLYDQALQKIPYMLTHENPQWKKYENLSDKELKTLSAPEVETYLERRNEMRGNIPLYRKQGEVLKAVAMHKIDARRVNMDKVAEILDTFFNSYVNPPRKKYSILGLLEELEWLHIRLKFYNRAISYSTGAGKVLREQLG